MIVLKLTIRTEEDYHYWNALSIHLLTAGNVQHEEQQHLEVEKVINSLKERLSPIGAPGKASFMTLRRLLTRIAQLGLKIAVLRYKFQWMDIQLGDIFHAKTMREIESSSDENDGVLEIENRPIKIILCPALGKSKFDSDGKLEEPVLMAKSLVSCVEM